MILDDSELERTVATIIGITRSSTSCIADTRVQRNTDNNLRHLG
jgi:predicted XRE-type DNA-binding protein